MAGSITPSLQEYLTAIYKREGHAKWIRTTVIAADLGIAPASVTEAFKRLAEEGYIEYLPYRGVRLTQKGIAIAENIVSKEAVVREALVRMGVSSEEADRLACLLEHTITDEAVRAILSFVNRCGGDAGSGKD
ncbi:MAG: metal-dependent transcriptional regulator [Acidilobus sp.]